MSRDHAVLHETKRDAVLRILSDLKWHSHVMLTIYGGPRYGARIRELKRIGYQVEAQDTNEENDGRCYRLLSMTPGEPATKKVKVFLTEEEALALLAVGRWRCQSPTAVQALEDAVGSFQTNKHKL